MTEGGMERDGDRGRRRKRRWKGEKEEEKTGVVKNKMGERHKETKQSM